MSIYEDNCQFFLEYLTYGHDLVSQMEAITESSYQLVGTDKLETLNVLKDGRAIYEGGAYRHMEKEINAFFEAPNRILLQQPARFKGENLSISRFKSELNNNLKGTAFYGDSEQKGGYAFILGLGLGLHVNILSLNLNVKEIIFAENNVELFKLCCQVFSWRELITQLKARGQSFYFFLNCSETELIMNTRNVLRNENISFVDGSYLFAHKDESENYDIRTGLMKELQRDALFSSLSLGYFEDEQKMMRNSLANLSSKDFYLLPQHPVSMKQATAFIVGSGPSVDKVIPLIKENQENLVIFACGTSLSVLLANNIIPDFATFFENNDLYNKFVEPLSQKYNLKNINMIGPTSVYPSLGKYFGKKIFYYRDILSPSMLFGTVENTIQYSGVTVANLALRSAVSFGFSKVYMSGVDLCSKFDSQHHSKDSIYYRDIAEGGQYSTSYWQEINDTDKFNIEAINTNGEKVLTNRFFSKSQESFILLMKAISSSKVINFSEGLPILNVEARKFDAAQEVNLTENKQDVIRTIFEEIEHINIEEMKPYMLDKIQMFLAIFKKKVEYIRLLCRQKKHEEFDAFAGDIVHLFVIGQHFLPENSAENAVKIMMSGNIVSHIQSGMFYWLRMEEKDKLFFMTEFKRTLLSFLDEYELHIEELFSDYL